jgi:hypothetical protein
MRQKHRAGEKMFVDYAGQTVQVYNLHTNHVCEAQIFVAVLGASNYNYAEVTHMVTMPIHLAKNIGIYDPTLYRYSTPLSTQIIFRILNGFDLEFSDEPLAIAKGFFQRDEISAPKFLLVVSLGRAGANVKEDIEINPDIFETFDDNL